MDINEMQTAIIDKTVDALLAAGLFLAVYDSEEITTPITNIKTVIIEALQTTDSDFLFCYPAPDTGRKGFVMFVYGNDGYDVICDYTSNLEDILISVNQYADDLCEAFA